LTNSSYLLVDSPHRVASWFVQREPCGRGRGQKSISGFYIVVNFPILWVLGSEFLHPNIINILTNIYTIFYVTISGHGKPVRYSETREFEQMFILVTDISFLEDAFLCGYGFG
jgi:hypothetical protein